MTVFQETPLSANLGPGGSKGSMWVQGTSKPMGSKRVHMVWSMYQRLVTDGTSDPDIWLSVNEE